MYLFHFPKDSMEKFIGYVGFPRELNGDYEIEFYIAKIIGEKDIVKKLVKQ